MEKIIDGKKIAQKITDNLKLKIEKLDIKPALAVIIVGSDRASQIYVRNKTKKAEEIGFNSILCELDENISKNELLNKIEELNQNPDINGILLQLPLPKHLDEKDFLDKISPDKDVDGFNTYNLGKLFKGENPSAISCTPKGIIRLLNEYNIQMEGKLALVIGRSNIVGKPVAALLLKNNATVIQAHSKTRNLQNLTKQADIIICATGKSEFLKGDMIKEGSVIIDVGISRKNDGKLTGDVDFQSVYDKVSLITPVPGGVGPMTIASLMENTYNLYLLQKGIEK